VELAGLEPATLGAIRAEADLPAQLGLAKAIRERVGSLRFSQFGRRVSRPRGATVPQKPLDLNLGSLKRQDPRAAG
jgi:hypothetical protein